jgi:ketosteroid isomerase-like protein
MPAVAVRAHVNWIIAYSISKWFKRSSYHQLTSLEILPALSHKVPWARAWRGRKEAEQYFKKIADALEFQEYAMDEFIAGDNSVVVLGHERCLVRATGRVVEAKWVQIFDFRDGQVCCHREYTDTAAWDAGFTSWFIAHRQTVHARRTDAPE